MDHAAALRAYPSRGDDLALPSAVTDAAPARRLRDAVEPVAMHAVWSRATNGALAAHGLNFLTTYVGGRSAYLGRPLGAVAAAAFAWFEPGLVASLWDATLGCISRDRLVELRDTTVTQSLREVLSEDDPSGIADLLAAATVGADGTGRPLFSGLRAAGAPGDPALRLWWACALIREHRGDSHVAAANAAGVGPVEMNILTELWLGMPLLSYTASRGWPEPAMLSAVASLEARSWLADGALTESGRAARLALEATTDAQEQSIVAALGDRLDEVCAQLDEWGRRCIEHGSFPADVLKRAAG